MSRPFPGPATVERPSSGRRGRRAARSPYPSGVLTVQALRPPATDHGWLRRVVLANLVVQVGVVVTGGLVRLTGSGLGCPTWPQCVPGSFTPVARQAQGVHKLIEFGNRTLAGVLTVAAVAVVVAVWRWAPHRRALRRLSLLPLLGVFAQAVLGGITVLTQLNPASVAAHFLLSMLLVGLSALLVYRVGEGDGPSLPVVRAEVRVLARVTAVMGAVVLVLGTVVTGSGPHSGDAVHPTRFGFDPRSVAWVHADAVMLFLGLVLATLVAVRVSDAAAAVQRAWLVVLAVTLLQGFIGYLQYYTGLPEAVVALHMLGASLLVVALTRAMLAMRTRSALAPMRGHAAIPAVRGSTATG